MKPDRMWCAIGAYPGQKQFIFGSVVATDRQHALARLAALWAETIPFPPPDFEPIAGEVIFVAAEELVA